MKENYVLRGMARAQLKNQWFTAVLLYLIYTTLAFIPNFIGGNIALILSHVISGPLLLGLISCFLGLVRNNELVFEKLFDGFSNFPNAFFTYLLRYIFIILWTLLFIIPGIVAIYKYSMVFYILKDNPDMTALNVITKSKEMMYGYKGKLFCLHLSFIGWDILCLFTLGIGFLWLSPYIQASEANFYQNLKDYHETKTNNSNTDTFSIDEEVKDF